MSKRQTNLANNFLIPKGSFIIDTAETCDMLIKWLPRFREFSISGRLTPYRGLVVQNVRRHLSMYDHDEIE